MTSEFGWVLIRQDEGANRYRVGRYATRAEAERVAETLTRPAGAIPATATPAAPQVYLIERVVPRAAEA